MLPGMPGGILGGLSRWPIGGGKTGRNTGFPPFILSCISFDYPFGTDFLIGGQQYVTDRVLILQEGTPTVEYVSSMTITASGIPQFDIISESVVLLQTTQPRIKVTYSASGVTLEWDGGGTLVSSTDVAAPLANWSAVPGATSPHVIPSGQLTGRRFFAVRVP